MAKTDAPKFVYKFAGDTVKRFRGKLLRPGDIVESDDELINGELEPQNPAAKAAKVATDAANDAAAETAARQRLEAMNGSLPVEVQQEAPAASNPSSSAPAAPVEA